MGQEKREERSHTVIHFITMPQHNDVLHAYHTSQHHTSWFSRKTFSLKSVTMNEKTTTHAHTLLMKRGDVLARRGFFKISTKPLSARKKYRPDLYTCMDLLWPQRFSFAAKREEGREREKEAVREFW